MHPNVGPDWSRVPPSCVVEADAMPESETHRTKQIDDVSRTTSWGTENRHVNKMFAQQDGLCPIGWID